ncbi:MAG TPA: cupin domain-containing protein [Solirubrobacterales bacterium]|jgi:mannose-6-phosphate isomerase-like protein (cupin superfamily)|nr:cupin domain-containing protein [Solirubrobacterales bacterium]
MPEPTLHLPGEGENFEMGASRISLKATSADTDGAFFLSETVVESGFAGPPLHIHHKLTDMFYVLEGTLTFRIGDDTVEGPAGTFVCAPPGVPHTFSNPGSQLARFLNFNVPGGFEAYMRELAAAWTENGGAPDPATIGAIASRHDFEVV